MILGDEDLKYYILMKKLVIEPVKEKTIRENGLDLTIDNEIAVEKIIEHPIWGLNRNYIPIIDSHNESDVKERFKKIGSTKDTTSEYFIISPNSLNLLSTQEYVKFGNDIMGFCSLRSTVARHGFIAPTTIVDAGFEGTLTIEVFYSGIRPFKLYVGDRFLHLIISKTNSPVKNVYNGVYIKQKGVRTPKCLD